MTKLKHQVKEIEANIERIKIVKRRFEGNLYYLSNDVLNVGKKEDEIECHACDTT